jgi:hypothetical protein
MFFTAARRPASQPSGWLIGAYISISYQWPTGIQLGDNVGADVRALFPAVYYPLFITIRPLL